MGVKRIGVRQAIPKMPKPRQIFTANLLRLENSLGLLVALLRINF